MKMTKVYRKRNFGQIYLKIMQKKWNNLQNKFLFFNLNKTL